MQGLWRRKSKKRGPKGVMPAVQFSATDTLASGASPLQNNPACRVELLRWRCHRQQLLPRRVRRSIYLLTFVDNKIANPYVSVRDRADDNFLADLHISPMKIDFQRR